MTTQIIQSAQKQVTAVNNIGNEVETKQQSQKKNEDLYQEYLTKKREETSAKLKKQIANTQDKNGSHQESPQKFKDVDETNQYPTTSHSNGETTQIIPTTTTDRHTESLVETTQSGSPTKANKLVPFQPINPIAKNSGKDFER